MFNIEKGTLYKRLKMSQNFLHLPNNNNLIMACHITGVHDVNRNTTLQNDDYKLVQNWAESITNAKLKGLIFHNNLSIDTCKKYTNESISFQKIRYNTQFNPNVYRYFVYQNFLKNKLQQLQHVFVTDISDVTLQKNPFTDTLFIENPTHLFCGDEPKTLHNDWMNEHCTYLRKNISDFEEFEDQFKNETLLNCGIIGGSIDLFYEFIQKLCAIHLYANKHNNTPFTGDMGAFNYLVRTQYHKQIIHGEPVNTVFKMYEKNRTDCWFAHK